MPGLPVQVYECQVTGVREDDRVLDAISRNGTTFKRTSYLLPWISANGSGIDVVPKTGDQCLVLATQASPTDSGRMAFVIGFKVPTNPLYAGQELGERLAGYPQGSVILRARAEDGNEAHVVLNAGGSLLMGANETCRTLYSPVDSSVITLFDNWVLKGPGGYVRWRREPGSGAVSYEAEHRTLVDPEQSAMRTHVRVGGEGEDPVEVTVHDGGPNPFLRVRVDASGEAWIEGESLNLIGRASINIDAPNLTIKKRPVLGQKDPI